MRIFLALELGWRGTYGLVQCGDANWLRKKVWETIPRRAEHFSIFWHTPCVMPGKLIPS